MLTISNSASHELLRQSISRGSPGDIYLKLVPEDTKEGWIFLRVNDWERSGVPIARTDGLTVYVM